MSVRVFFSCCSDPDPDKSCVLCSGLSYTSHHMPHPGNPTPLPWNLSFSDQWRREWVRSGGEEGRGGRDELKGEQRDLLWSALKVFLIPACPLTASSSLMCVFCPANHLSAGMKLERERERDSGLDHTRLSSSSPLLISPSWSAVNTSVSIKISKSVSELGWNDTETEVITIRRDPAIQGCLKQKLFFERPHDKAW